MNHIMEGKMNGRCDAQHYLLPALSNMMVGVVLLVVAIAVGDDHDRVVAEDTLAS